MDCAGNRRRPLSNIYHALHDLTPLRGRSFAIGPQATCPRISAMPCNVRPHWPQGFALPFTSSLSKISRTSSTNLQTLSDSPVRKIHHQTLVTLRLIEVSKHTGWAKKTGPFLNVDNFAKVSGRKACDMSKVCKFCLEESMKLA